MSKEIKDMTQAELEARRKGFAATLSKLNKAAQKGSGAIKSDVVISKLGDNPEIDVERISSGSVVLDAILGGGFGAGRIVEIYGPESSGKTSIALNAIADVQRKGGNAVFIDAEQALDPAYSRTLGVDTDELGITQLSIAEEVFQMTLALINSGSVDIIVIDSIAQLIPLAEFEDVSKTQVATLARVISKYIRHIALAASQTGCTIILLNQIREKVGVMFGNPETTPGGRAIKFAASQRIEIRRKGVVKEGSETIGTEVRMKIVKNKLGAPFQEGLTVLTFGQGINRSAEAVEIGEEFKVLEKRGNTYFFTPKDAIELDENGIAELTGEGNEIKLGGSKKRAIEALEKDTNLYQAIVNEVLYILEMKRGGITNREEEEEDDIDLDLFNEEE